VPLTPPFTPYGLYQQLLAAWAGVATDQGEEVVRPALEEALSVVMGNNDLWPLLARMMGMAGGAGLVRLGPEELQRATFSAMGSVVSRLVAIGPTVLVLEDLHWADPTSLCLSTELAALAQDGPLLVLATRRPDPGPEPSSFERSLTTGPVPLHRVEIGPLPEEAEQELASSLVGKGAPRGAGEHAARAFANEEAILAFRSALEIADEDGSNNEVMARAAAGVWAKLAEVLWATWRLGEAREAFQAAIRLVGPDDALQGAHLYALLGKLEGCDYRHSAALAAFDAAEELLGERPWDKGDAWAEVWLEVMLNGGLSFTSTATSRS
jgi:tetratricopeptide (TPR) repeat protein